MSNNTIKPIHIVNQQVKHLEDLIKTREIQKTKLEMLNKQKEFFENPNHQPVNDKQTKLEDKDQNENIAIVEVLESDELQITCDKNPNYTALWDAYFPFPFSDSNDSDRRLYFELFYTTFSGILIKKWSTSLSTPPVSVFHNKDIFNLSLLTDNSNFDFNFKFENLQPNSPSINIGPKSTISPLNPNQFVLIKDPHHSQESTVSAIIAHYNTTDQYLNQFNGSIDSFDRIKNLFISTQLFFIHINQIKERVKLSLAHDSKLGENLLRVMIETDAKVEIKETLIPVKINADQASDLMVNIVIAKKVVYINGKYFMTYATYINDVYAAVELAGHTNDNIYQLPLQLAIMLLFEAMVPVIDLDKRAGKTEHERLLIRLCRDILKPK